MKTRNRSIAILITLFLIALTLWQPAIAQDSPQISPFELSRYPSGGSVQSAMWSADETRILTTSRRSSAQIWQANADAPQTILLSSGWVDGAVWNGEESAILSWSNAPLTCQEDCEYTVNLWMNIEESATEPSMSLTHPAFIYSAEWNANESQIMTAAGDGLVRIWSIENSEIVAEFRHEAAVLGAKWNADETQILSWSMDGTARVWEVESGDDIGHFGHEGWVEGAIWDAEETRVLTWGRDGSAKIWNNDGELVQELKHDDWVTSAQWSADGRQILTGSMDGTLRVWETRSGEENVRLAQHGMVQGASWNSDETQILAWALTIEGHVVTIWDVEHEAVMASLAHEDVIHGAGWNADDNRVLTWSDDGTVRVWVVPSGNDCVISAAPALTVRQRSIPSTEGDIMGRLLEGDASVAIGQAVGEDGFVWYQLIDESWVRSDVVEATGACEGLTEVEASP